MFVLSLVIAQRQPSTINSFFLYFYVFFVSIKISFSRLSTSLGFFPPYFLNPYVLLSFLSSFVR